MIERERCPDCGIELVSDSAIAGHCPRCLLSLALSGDEPEELPTLGRGGEAFSSGQILGERYQIRSLLGRGGMGEVWQAFDLKLRVDVALKALRAELLEKEHARELLRGEVRSAREVVSPQVCRIFDLVTEYGQELVSMEYIDGTTLAEILCNRGPLELQEAREIASQFLSGLEAIHQAELVHRDFKPENVMVTRSGRVVVMDFGIAKALADARTGTISGTPAYMAPEQARGASVDARADVFSAAVVLAEMIAVGGKRDGRARQELWHAVRQVPPQLPESPWTPVLEKALAFDRDARYGSAQALARALEEVTLRVPGYEEKQPYPGLAVFTEEDAEYFFGRELEVEAIWKKLERPHLLALIGPSGTGKSSFLRAGLLAALPDGWKSVLCIPGDRPFQILARALVPLFAGDTEAMQQLLRFEEPDAAVSLLSRLRQRHEHALIIVDQFEELFTQNPREVQEAFATLLGRLALEADVHVVLSMRDDFLFHCYAHEALAPIFSELTLLGSLSESALRRALVQPALACGYRFEDETLVDEMVSEVSPERGALPLLAFAASRLWERRDRESGLLTRRAYEEVGGVSGALAQHAEETLEQVGLSRLPIVREIFRNLVTAQGTRASRTMDELLSVFDSDDDRAAASQILQTLINARLLTAYERAEGDETSEQRIEIIHESLLSAWPRLVRWQTQDADSTQLRDQLRQAAQMWEQRSRPDDLLWTGTSFKEYELWRERYAGGLSEQEETFASAMSTKTARRRRQRRFAVAAVVTLALGVAAVTSSLWQRSETARQESVSEARRAEASKLLALAQLRRETDLTEALAYTTASLELADSEEARLFAMRLRWEGPPALELEPEGVMNRVPAFSPDGRRLAVTGHSKEVRVWSEENGGQPHVLPGHRTSPRGPSHGAWASETLLVTCEGRIPDMRCHVWKFPEGELVRTIECAGTQVGRDALYCVTPETVSGREILRFRSWVLPDGRPRELGRLEWLALDNAEPSLFRRRPSRFLRDGRGFLYAIGRNVYLRPLPADSGSNDRLIGRHPTDVDSIRPLRGEPVRMLTRDRSGEHRIWDFSKDEPEILKAFSLPEERVPDLWEARWAISRTSLSKERQVWSLDGWSDARPLTLNRSGARDTSGWGFHPRGDWLVASTHGMTRLTFWPLHGNLPRVIDGYPLDAPLAFSPDGLWLAAAADQSSDSLQLLPLPANSSREVKTLSLPERQLWINLVFDPRGRFLFVVGNQGRAYHVPLDGSPPRRLEGFSDNAMLAGTAISPSGRQVATAPVFGGGARALRVWDLETDELRVFDLPKGSSSESGWEQGVVDLAFTDETTLYTAGDGGVRRWNLESGRHELVFATRPGYLAAMAFSPERRTALVQERKMAVPTEGGTVQILDLATGETQARPAFGEPSKVDLVFGGHLPVALDPSGEVAASGDGQGIVRVGRVSGGEPHLLVGHEGTVRFVAISPDRRWVASSGEDRTLRLWPMPDLSKPPLHTLPHDELIAKLKSMTNLRVVRDPESEAGWKVELDPFPGWKEVPTW